MDSLIKYPLPGDVIETESGEFLEVTSILQAKEGIQQIYSEKTVETKLNSKYFMTPLNDIKRIHYADENEEDSNQFINGTLKFRRFLSNGAKIDIKRIGITPNNLSGTSSKIKLVIYGLSESINVREYLRKCHEKRADIPDEFKDCVIRPFNFEELKNMFYSKNFPPSISMNDFMKFEYRKLRHGNFNDCPYFIKFLEFNNREEFKIQSEKQFEANILDIGHAKITGDVRDNLYWWTTPARVGIGNINILEYEASSLNQDFMKKSDLRLDQFKEIYIFDDRYIENIRLLEQFEAYGMIRLIQNKEESPFLQLYIEPGTQDYVKLK